MVGFTYTEAPYSSFQNCGGLPGINTNEADFNGFIRNYFCIKSSNDDSGSMGSNEFVASKFQLIAGSSPHFLSGFGQTYSEDSHDDSRRCSKDKTKTFNVSTDESSKNAEDSGKCATVIGGLCVLGCVGAHIFREKASAKNSKGNK